MAIRVAASRNEMCKQYAERADHIGVCVTIGVNASDVVTTLTGEGPYSPATRPVIPAWNGSSTFVGGSPNTNQITTPSPITITVTGTATYANCLLATSAGSTAGDMSTVWDFCSISNVSVTGGGQIVVTPTYTQT